MKTIRFLVALILLALPVLSHSQVIFGAPVTGTATTSSAKKLNWNSLRTYLIILNTGSTNTMYVKFGSAQSGTEGIPILPNNGYYEPVEAPSNSVYIVTGSSTTTYTIIEGN